jgi:hypothetical protein
MSPYRDLSRTEQGARIHNKHIVGSTEGSGSTTSTVPASIELSVILSVLTIGATEQIIATIRNAAGTVLAVQPDGWSSASPTVVSVDGAGRITAQGAGGPVLITAVLSSYSLSTSTPITVTGPDLVAASVEITPTTVSFQSGTAQLTAIIKNAGGAVLSLSPTSWTSDTPAVATVNSSGVVTFVGVGTTNVQAHYNAIPSNICVVTGVAGGGGGGLTGTNFAKHDFEDGTLGPFYNPWKTGIDVFSGTIGGRTGNFCRIHFVNGVGQVDANLAIFPTTPIIRRLGEHLWCQFDYYVDNTIDAMRKLLYFSGVYSSQSSSHVTVLMPGFGADSNQLAVTADVAGGSGNFFDYLSTFVSTKTWHRVKVHVQLNSSFSAQDGVLQVWLDGALVFEGLNMLFVSSLWTTDPSLFQWDSFGIGYQCQAVGGGLFDEYRYIDNASFASAASAL